MIKARDGWRRLKANYGDEPAGKTDNERFTKWRRAELMLAVGKDSLCACVQSEYKRIEAHFLAFGTDKAEAFGAAMKAEAPKDEELIKNMWFVLSNPKDGLLGQAANYGFGFEYFEKIMKQTCKVRDLKQLSVKQLRQFITTVKRTVLDAKKRSEVGAVTIECPF